MKLTDQEVSIIQRIRKLRNGYLHIAVQAGKVVSINLLPSLVITSK